MPWTPWPTPGSATDIILRFLAEARNSSNQSGNKSWMDSSYLVYSILVILGVLVAIIIAITVSYVRLKKRVDDKYTITSSPPTSISSCAYSASRSSLSGFTEPDITGVHTSFHGKHIKNSPFRSNASIKGVSSGSDVPGFSPHKKISKTGQSQHVYDNVGAIMY